MEERGIDRRVRKTKRQLRQALMDLMSEKPSKSISVRELAERARHQPRDLLYPL